MQESGRTKKKACIVGAGLTGLVAARSLARAGFEVTILESELHAGGMLSTFRIGWEDLERIPHLIGPGDRNLLGLFRDLGLDGLIEWFPPSTALYLEGVHHRITQAKDLLALRPLSFRNRLLAVLSSASRRLPPYLCEESLRALFSPRSGAKSFELPEEWFAACTSCIAPKRPVEASDKAGYPAGGFSVLVKSLLKEIEAHGGEFRYGCTVTDIRPDEGGFTLDCILEDCSSFVFSTETVVATVSARRFAEMAAGAGLPETDLQRLRSSRSIGHLSLVLRLKQPLSSYHRTLVPADAPFRLVTEHSGLVGLRRYGGHIVYLSRDVDTADPLWTQSDGEVFRLFFRRLAEMHPGILRSDVKDWRLTRKRYAGMLPVQPGASSGPPSDFGRQSLYLAGCAGTSMDEHSLDRSVRAGLAVAERARHEQVPSVDSSISTGQHESEVL